MNYIDLNGKLLEAAAPALQTDNRAFRYGYGLFETMLVRDGAIQLKDYHWRRLWSGLGRLKISIPRLLTPALLEERVLRVVAKNKLNKLCRVRLQVFPGNGGLYDGNSFSAEYLVECFPLEESVPGFNEAGLVMGIAEGLVKHPDGLSDLKICNGLVYALAARQAKENKWNDALVANSTGHIIESAISNLFWVKNGRIYTPPLSEGCIGGVMRAFLLDKATEKGIEIIEKPLPVAELMAADEVFLTNAIRRIKWVRTVADTTFQCAESQRFSAIIF